MRIIAITEAELEIDLLVKEIEHAVSCVTMNQIQPRMQGVVTISKQSEKF